MTLPASGCLSTLWTRGGVATDAPTGQHGDSRSVGEAGPP
jgi:hypothetical protein